MGIAPHVTQVFSFYIEELYIMGRAACDSIAVKPLGVLEDSRAGDLTAAEVEAYKTSWHRSKSPVKKRKKKETYTP